MSFRILLFGASEGGRQTLYQLSKRTKVVAFIDSNPSKRDTFFEGYPVYSPEHIPELDFDFVVISSMHVDPIRRRLIELGVPDEKIASGLLYVNAPPAFPWDAVLFLALLAGCTALALAATAAYLIS